MQVSEQIIQVLNYLGEKLGVTMNWTSENVLPYIQTLCNKYINWEIATSVFYLIIGILLFGLAILTFIYAKRCYSRYKNNKSSYYDVSAMILGITCGCLAITGILMIMLQITDIIKCIYFPELKIYEYVQMLINN